MGLRFRKSVKITPGLKLNFNKNSTSVTAGVRGAHYTVNSKGTRTASVGIPDTGLSYVETSKSTKKNTSKKSSTGKRSKGGISKLLGVLFAGCLLFSCGGDPLDSITLTADENSIYNTNDSVPIEVTTNPDDYELDDIAWKTTGGKIIEQGDSYAFVCEKEGVFSIVATIDDVTSNSLQITVDDDATEDISSELPDEDSSESETTNDSSESDNPGTDSESTDTTPSSSQEENDNQTSTDEKTNSEFSQDDVVEQLEENSGNDTVVDTPHQLDSEQASSSESETPQTPSSEEPSGNVSETPQETTVWIPRSGSKYHRSPSCSNMKNPTEVPISEAQARGYKPCKSCY